MVNPEPVPSQFVPFVKVPGGAAATLLRLSYGLFLISPMKFMLLLFSNIYRNGTFFVMTKSIM